VKSQKISEMAAIMNRATKIDGHQAENNRQLIKDLEFENHLMRQLLQIDSDEDSGSKGLTVAVQCPDVGPSLNIDTQTDDYTNGSFSSPANDDDLFCLATCSTLVRNPRHSTYAVSDAKSLLGDASLSQCPPKDLPSVTTDEHDAEPFVVSPDCRDANQESSVDAERFPKDIGDENMSKGLSTGIVSNSNDALVERLENTSADSSWHQDNCNCCNNNEMSVASCDRLNENNEALHDGSLDATISPIESHNSPSNATQAGCLDITIKNDTIDNSRSAQESTENISSVEDTSLVAD